MKCLQEIQAKLDNVPRRLRNSRAATGEAVLRPLCRESVRPQASSLHAPVLLLPFLQCPALESSTTCRHVLS